MGSLCLGGIQVQVTTSHDSHSQIKKEDSSPQQRGISMNILTNTITETTHKI